MKRISVTTIEKFRRFTLSLTPVDTQANLIASIKGEFKGSNKSNIGGAYHQIIEGKYLAPHPDSEDNYIRVGDFYFTRQQAEAALIYRDKQRLMIHEFDVNKTYYSIMGPIQVSGRVDGGVGFYLRDAKLRFRNYNYMDYSQSCQWKFYCDMLNAPYFYYDLITVKGWKDDYDTFSLPFYVPSEVIFTLEEPMEMLFYEGAKYEILDLLNGLLDFIKVMKLEDYLKPERAPAYAYDLI